MITVVHDCDIERRGDGSAPADNEGDFRDCHMEEGSPDLPFNNYQMDIGLKSSGKDGTIENRGLVLFDLYSFLPADAAITAAVWHVDIPLTDAVAGQPFYIKRCTRTDWVEASATWNKYDGANTWTTPGGDMATPEVTLGDITTTGWKSFDIKTIVDDAWDNRSGILTFIVFRKPADDDTVGRAFIDAKNRRTLPEYDTHHLRITYTLDSKTFEAVIQ